MKDLLVTSILLGIGLAMDAFSVSLASGLREPDMSAGRSITISGTFGAFQFAMPLIGWVCVHTIASWFGWFEKLVPWIALALLGFIGVKMIIEGFKGG
ncbi:MAG: manganese efflux pump, partial [Firmicutes bacterium]|nr:manganese efflux pump [Bacillota bacterium]